MPVPLIAKSLYEYMNRLDPEPDDPPWENLMEREREFYVLCVGHVLDHVGLCRRLSNDDQITGKLHEGEQPNRDD